MRHGYGHPVPIQVCDYKGVNWRAVRDVKRIHNGDDVGAKLRAEPREGGVGKLCLCRVHQPEPVVGLRVLEFRVICLCRVHEPEPGMG